MTQTNPENPAPKKPRKKPAAPKSAAESPGAENTPPNDTQLKDAVLAAALPHAAFDGFTDTVLTRAGQEAGVSAADLARLFEGGPIGLVAYYSE